MRARLACGVRLSDRIALFQEEQAARRPSPIGARVRSFSIRRPIEDVVLEAQAFRPQVLYGFPDYLARLADIATGRLQPRLASRRASSSTRRRVSAARRASAAACSTSTAAARSRKSPGSARAREGYHLNADWLVLETAPDGAAGRGGTLLVTALFNYAMPLLRYGLGDTGEILDEACSCGRGLPLVRPTLGAASTISCSRTAPWFRPTV